MSFRNLPDKWVVCAVRFWGRATLKIAGIELILENSIPFVKRQSAVVVCNHQSILDLLWGAAICPHAPLVIGKKELRWIPVVNLIWWAMGFIFVDRRDHAKAMASINGVADIIRTQQRSFIIAPEGTRSPDGAILPFKKGAFYLAISAKAPVYPIVVDGAFELLPKQNKLPKKGKIRLRFLAPVSTIGLTEGDVEKLKDSVRTEMLASLSDMRK